VDSYCAIIVYVPVTHADEIRDILGKTGAGSLGKYSFCSFSSKGTGRFLPHEDATPFRGSSGTIEEVEEERIEVIAPQERLPEILEALNAAHPYEEPAVHVIPLLMASHSDT
jgi:hypothetical protein